MFALTARLTIQIRCDGLSLLFSLKETNGVSSGFTIRYSAGGRKRCEYEVPFFELPFFRCSFSSLTSGGVNQAGLSAAKASAMLWFCLDRQRPVTLNAP